MNYLYRNKASVYLNTLATLSFLFILVFFVFIVNSFDLLRSRVENQTTLLRQIENKLSAPLFISKNKQKVQRKLGQVANSALYDLSRDNGGRIISPIVSETANMNSIINNDSMVSSLWDLAYDSLAQRSLKKPEIFEAKLAESWTLSENKLVYTIHLRRGVLWHDFTDPVTNKTFANVEVTAKDFKFYVDVIKNSKVDAAPMRVYFTDLKKLDVIDDYTFKVYWARPYFLSESMTLGLIPLPRHFYAYSGKFDPLKFNDDFKRNRIIVGCGPYRFDSWVKGKRIIMKRWEKYWGRNFGIMPAIKLRIFEVIKKPSTQFQALIASKVDRMGLTPQLWKERTDIPAFDSKSPLFKIKRFKYPQRSYSYIGYNLKNSIFKDRRVRRAMTHLVNRKRILKEIYFNLGRIVTGNFYIDSPYYDKDIKALDFNIDKAKAILKDAGWKDSNNNGILDKNGIEFKFVFMSIANSSIQERMCPILKEDFKKAGISMEISPVEWSVYTERLKTKSFDVCALGWSMGYESDPFQIWHSSQADVEGSSNHISFRNKKADSLIEAIRVSFDVEERIKLCKEFHRLINDEQPYTFLISPYALVAQHKRYKNTDVYPLGMDTKLFWVPSQKQLSNF